MPNTRDDMWPDVKIKLAMAGENLIELAGIMVASPNHVPAAVYRSMARLKALDALAALDVLDQVAETRSWKVIEAVEADSPIGP